MPDTPDALLTPSGIIPKGWMQAQIAIHVHFSVWVSETQSCDYCALFERERSDDRLLVQQPRRSDPADAPEVGEQFVDTQGAVFIQVGQVSEDGQDVRLRMGALVRLRFLDKCPRLPVDWQTEQGAALWLLLSAPHLSNETALGGMNRVCIPPTWFFPCVSRYKVTHGMVERHPSVLNGISEDQAPPDTRRLRGWVDRNYPPGTISLKIDFDTIGISFDESVQFRVQSIHMFIGASELGSRTGDACVSPAGS